MELSQPEHADESLLVPSTGLLARDEQVDVPPAEAQRLLRLAFLRTRLNLEELRPFRVRAAWRWARELSVLKCMVGDDEMLSEALIGCEVSPWSVGSAGNAPHGGGYFKLRADVVSLVCGPDGVAILPPEVPAEFLGPQGEILPTYEPRRDMPLLKWMMAFDRVQLYLGTMRGTAENPDEGRYGLWGLQDPDTVRLCFPSPLQILTWEGMLVRETWHTLVRGGQLTTERELRDRYGLTDVEVSRVVRLAQNHGMMNFQSDAEVNRAVLAARLEEFIQRVREAPSDQRAELGALKLLAQIMGVTRIEADDFMKEVSAMIGRVSKEPPRTLSATATARTLPPG